MTDIYCHEPRNYPVGLAPISTRLLLAISTILLLVFPTTISRAQTVGTCNLGSAVRFLDVNNVEAQVQNNGGLFWRGSGNTYRVPKDGSAHGFFAAGIWLGGLDDNEVLRFAGTMYGPFEYWPGPLDSNGDPPADCSLFDRIYKISRLDVDQYELDGTTTPDLEDWPVDLGAGVIDGDGIPDNYDLEAGDRPEIFGDQTLFWVMNDAGNEKGWSMRQPIGVELRVTAYAFATEDALDNTTFYRYQLINKGSVDLSDTYMGFWSDVELGHRTDDLVGSDTLLHMGFVYNGDDYDEDSEGYGHDPPALGISILESPLAVTDGRDNDYDGSVDEDGEQAGMSSFLENAGDSSAQGNPDGDSIEPYYFLQGRWRDGSSMTVGGVGVGGSTTTNYLYPGDPTTLSFWSQENQIGVGDRATPTDRSFLMSSGPFPFASGDTTVLEFAIVWSRAENRLASVTQMKNDVRYVRALYADTTFSPETPPIPETPVLLSPTNGAAEVVGEPTFIWQQPADSLLYAFEVSMDSLFSEPVETVETYSDGSTTVELPQAGTFYWRVRAFDGISGSEFSQTYSFNAVEQGTALTGFASFETVANGAGPIDPPTGGAADFQAFPVPERPDESQQVGPGIWFVNTGDVGTGSSYTDVFIPRSIRNGWGPVIPWDWEIRVTEQCYQEWRAATDSSNPFATPDDGCYSYDRFGIFGDNRPMLVPFELWNIGVGTPEDTTDDFRLIPVNIDWEGDGFDLQWFDSSVSAGDDDPESDWFYWFLPCDESCENDDLSPGQAGYNRWQSDILAGTAFDTHGSEVMARFVFNNWNGGSISAASDKEDYLANVVNQDMPEAGTVFRLVSNKPVSASLLVNLSGAHIGGHVSSTGTGSVNLSVPPVGFLNGSGAFDDLDGDFISATLYRGNGDPVADFDVSVDGDNRGGTITGLATAVDRQSLPDNPALSVKVHTTAAPDGEIVGQLLPSSNAAPGPSTITYPSPDSTIDLQGAAELPFTPRWQSSGDPNGNFLNHIWQLSPDSLFSRIILTSNAGSDQRVDIDYGTLSDVLQMEGYSVSQTARVFHRVAVSDGSLITYSPGAPVTFDVGVVVGIDDDLLPDKFALVGNYPNPFNGHTSILLDVPVHASVEVEVFDILGRRIRLIEQEVVPGSARRIDIAASGMASGVYVYRVTATSPGRKWRGSDSMVVVR